MNEEHEYALDVKMYACLRVKAKSLKEAREMVRSSVDGTGDVNFGTWPNGDSIIACASVGDDEFPCFEVDGDFDHPDCDG